MKTLKTFCVSTVAFLCLFGMAQGQTATVIKNSQEPPTSFQMSHGEHKHAKMYVDAKAAGYDKLSDDQQIRTTKFQVLAMKQPAAPVCRLESAKDWEAFIKKFVGIEIETGMKLRFEPDFNREQVVAFYAGPELRGDGFMDIELYDGDKILKAFVFHGGILEGKDPFAISKKTGKPFRGTFYLTTVPKRLRNKTIEFRMAYQSWGRVCSRFSSPIKNASRGARAGIKGAE